MHNLDDKYPIRPRLEPITSEFRVTTRSNEPSEPVLSLVICWSACGDIMVSLIIPHWPPEPLQWLIPSHQQMISVNPAIPWYRSTQESHLVRAAQLAADRSQAIVSAMLGQHVKHLADLTPAFVQSWANVRPEALMRLLQFRCVMWLRRHVRHCPLEENCSNCLLGK